MRTDADTLDTMRRALVRKGTSPLVRLSFRGGSGGAYFNETFVQQCVDEVAKVTRLAASGIEQPTPLERLAIHLLLDSALIDH